MTQQMPYANARATKAMNPEQLNQIVEAILAGKYSWACVLLLRCAGYNPLHYIPYRTYNRLLKENCQFGRPSQAKADKINNHEQNPAIQCKEASSNKGLSQITDLDYLETADEASTEVDGGYLDERLVFSQGESKLFATELKQLQYHLSSFFNSNFL